MLRLLLFVFCLNIACAHASDTPDAEQIKKEIILEISADFAGHPHVRPIFLLVGGYPGAGKTTLINALADEHDLTIISWNAIRQAFLDRHLRGTSFDKEHFESIHLTLLTKCLEQHSNIVIDANAHAQNIKTFEDFLEAEGYGQEYRVVKLCLNPPIETHFKRLRAREQKEELHQGTESDLERDLNLPFKKINFNDYALVINTEEVPFETELKIVNAFLEPLFANQE
jgi:cytidylate kinase